MENTHIQWCDHTFNPWIGCTKVSPGCKNCYAETLDKRWRKGVHWGKGAPRQRTSEAYWKQPLKWNNIGALRGIYRDDYHRPRVFCASLADVFDDEVPERWREDLEELIFSTGNLDWLLLTKRPENWAKFSMWDEPPSNVWIGTSVEDQERADERIPKLLEIPAKVRFLSCEPLLGRVDLCEPLGVWWNQTRSEFEVEPSRLGIHWVIVGGESGPNARPFNIEWARSLRGQCQAAGCAFFMKQLGRNPRIDKSEESQIHGNMFLRDRAGGDMDEWPSDLRIRQFPVVTA